MSDPAVDAALAAASRLLGMELVFIGQLAGERFRFARVCGERWPGIVEGGELPRRDSLCHRLLSGAPAYAPDTAADPAYRDAPARAALGIACYVGVPIVAPDGRVLGTLCGIDRRRVELPAAALPVLHALAEVVAARLAGETVIRRGAAGWTVDAPVRDDAADPQTPVDDETEELLTAMTLADLLDRPEPSGGRPPRPNPDADERAQLALSVRQLQHALAARVVVEQAIGVLAERQALAPRAAFERLRRCARARGRRVHELAGEIVASSTDRAVPLPPELAGRR